MKPGHPIGRVGLHAIAGLLPLMAWLGWRWDTAALAELALVGGCLASALGLLRWHSMKLQQAFDAALAERSASLAASETLYRQLADLSPQILWQADEHGDAIYQNPSWHALVGPREGGWLGARWMAALHPDDVEASQAAWQAAARNRQTLRLHRRFRSQHGEYRSFLGVATPVLRADGSVAGWVGVDSDITELERHVSRLEQVNADVEAVSYAVSHDLRAPVQVIKGFADAMLSNHLGAVDDTARGGLERIHRNALLMDERISDLLSLLTLSREVLHVEPINPLVLAKRVAARLQDLHRECVVECVTSGSGELWADRRLMQVLLEKLLDNAVKFSPDQPVCRIDVLARCEHDEMVLQVADRGLGFPAELGARLFRPFQRLHSNGRFPGSGVGLATARRIVQLHGGAIEGRNREGGGAIFEIRLPVRSARPVHSTTEKA